VVWCLSGIEVCRFTAHKWRDCRWAKSIAARKLDLECRSSPRRVSVQDANVVHSLAYELVIPVNM
jgi:hypothetical protein